MENHRNNFDLLRLLAACQVVSAHASEWLKLQIPPIIAEVIGLFPGVPVFFVISGFLIPASFSGSRSTAHYFVKRALRIYPGMWVNIASIFVLLASFGVIKTIDGEMTTYAAVLMLTGSTIFAGDLSNPAFYWNPAMPFFPGGVLWTITIELGFYILVPFIFSWNRQITWFSVAAGAVASFACQWWQQTSLHSNAMFTTIPAYLWMFLIGSAAWLAWDKIRPAFEGWALLWIGAYIAYSMKTQAGTDFQNLTVAGTLQILLLAGSVLSSAYTLPSLAERLVRQDISYGVYLYHMPVIMMLMAFGFSRNAWLWTVVFGATALVATLSWLCIERPALKMRTLMTGTMRVRPAALEA